MKGYYILDGKEPVEVSDIVAWAIQFEQADRIVEQTPLSEDVRVSTVFLGRDHRFVGEGPPLLFETMVFGGKHDREEWRYSTWDEAAAGHKAVVGELTSPRLIRWLRRAVAWLRRKAASLHDKKEKPNEET